MEKEKMKELVLGSRPPGTTKMMKEEDEKKAKYFVAKEKQDWRKNEYLNS